MELLRIRVDELLAEQRVATRSLHKYNTQLSAALTHQKELQAVQELFQTAVKLLYDNLSSQLGDIVTEGISLIFPDTQYKFVVEFIERRNSIEADIYLKDSNGEHYNLLSDVGGGLTDFVSLMFRITYIILSGKKRILYADEPLHFLSRDMVDTAAQFLRKICEDFNFRCVLISHIPEMCDNASVVYNVVQKGVSTVTKVKDERNHKLRTQIKINN